MKNADSYYKRLYSQVLNESTGSALIRVEVAFKNEQEFFKLNFPDSFSSTASELEKLFLKTVVENLKEKAVNESDGLPWMMLNARDESVKCLYRLFKMLGDFFEGIRQPYRNFVVSTIKNYLSESGSDLKGKKHSKVFLNFFITIEGNV